MTTPTPDDEATIPQTTTYDAKRYDFKRDWFFLYVVAVIIITAASWPQDDAYMYLAILGNLLKFVLPVWLIRRWLRPK